MGGNRLVEPLVFMLRVEGRQVGRHAEGHGGQRGDRLQAFHQLAPLVNSTNAGENCSLACG